MSAAVSASASVPASVPAPGAVPAADVVRGLVDLGVGLASGVPCSYLAGPLRLLERGAGPRYLGAVNEGAAMAIAAGAALVGAPGAVLAQNSGFGNLINPLTSLVLPYRIPVLVLLSMRGWPSCGPGEQQHMWMGRVVPDWLDSLGVARFWLAAGQGTLATALDGAGEALAAGRAAFVLVGKGAIAADDPGPLTPSSEPAGPVGQVGPAEPVAPGGAPTRAQLVAALLAELDGEGVLSTTGFVSRELFAQGDTERNFYMQGSMGHVGAVALGAALSCPDRRFVVLDGDGAALMHLGTLATIGHAGPANLTHVVWDNNSYESTGAQPRDASRADVAAVARGCGYRDVTSVDDSAHLRPALRAALRAVQRRGGPVMVVVRGHGGGVPGGRASEQLAPEAIAVRFRAGLTPAVAEAGPR